MTGTRRIPFYRMAGVDVAKHEIIDDQSGSFRNRNIVHDIQRQFGAFGVPHMMHLWLEEASLGCPASIA